MKNVFYKKKSLEFNADFKSTCCINTFSNLYSLMLKLTEKAIRSEGMDGHNFIIKKLQFLKKYFSYYVILYVKV